MEDPMDREAVWEPSAATETATNHVSQLSPEPSID